MKNQQKQLGFNAYALDGCPKILFAGSFSFFIHNDLLIKALLRQLNT